MSPTHKPLKKQPAGQATPAQDKSAVSSPRRGEYVIAPAQSRKVNGMLGRIERCSEALAATADRLLKRVS